MNEDQKKPNQDHQNPEKSSQSRGDPGGSDRGSTQPTPRPTENQAKVDRGSVPASVLQQNVEQDDSTYNDRGLTPPTPEPTDNPAKVD